MRIEVISRELNSMIMKRQTTLFQSALFLLLGVFLSASLMAQVENPQVALDKWKEDENRIALQKRNSVLQFCFQRQAYFEDESNIPYQAKDTDEDVAIYNEWKEHFSQFSTHYEDLITLANKSYDHRIKAIQKIYDNKSAPISSN